MTAVTANSQPPKKSAPAPKTTLTLGSFTFAGLEIPVSVPFGTSQALSIHRLLGGVRIIDAMGPDYVPPEWSGLFFGANAFARAKQLEAIAAGGQQQNLTYGKQSYLVMVRDFRADFRQVFEIPYHISCEVITDQTAGINVSSSPTTDQSIYDDVNYAAQLSALLTAKAKAADVAAIKAIESLVAAIRDAQLLVTTFVGAPLSTIASVLVPIAAAQAAVTGLISKTDAALITTGFAGVVSGGNPQAMAASLLNAADAMNQESTLWQLSNVLGRMSANLNAVSSSPNTVSVAGGNLFQVAVQQYGDATAWATIAAANGLTDPFIQGVKALTIPLQPGSTGGVVNK